MTKKIDFLNGVFPAPTAKPVQAGTSAGKKEKAYYTTQELAAVLNLSVGWVEKWRHKIVGGRQVGRIWRFDRAIIDARIAKGQDVRFSKT